MLSFYIFLLQGRRCFLHWWMHGDVWTMLPRGVGPDPPSVRETQVDEALLLVSYDMLYICFVFRQVCIEQMSLGQFFARIVIPHFYLK